MSEIYRTLSRLYKVREFLQDQVFTTLLQFYSRHGTGTDLFLRLRPEIHYHEEAALRNSLSMVRKQIAEVTKQIQELITLLEQSND